jgi:hypothetical protein
MFNEMLRSIQSGFSKIATPQRLFVLFIFLVLAWFLTSYSETKSFSMDSMETGTDDSATPQLPSIDVSKPADSNRPALPNDPALPKHLLPTDDNSQWAELNPVNMNQGSILAGDMLQAGYHIGLDTIGQTLKNANLQLRSDPIIPKVDVGPWNQSTYEPDYGRVPLEIGYGPSM